jgi:hypothetical protein
MAIPLVVPCCFVFHEFFDSRKLKTENLSGRINKKATATTMGLISIKNLIKIILTITTDIRNVNTKINLFFISNKILVRDLTLFFSHLKM